MSLSSRRALATRVRRLRARLRATRRRILAQCKRARARLKARAAAYRAERRAETNETIAGWRKDARDQCAERKALTTALRAQVEAESAAQREALSAEAAELAVAKARRRAGRKPGRRPPKGIASIQESDELVEYDVPPELLSVWRATKSRIRGTDKKSRTEAFLEWVEENPEEATRIADEKAAKDLDAAIAEHEREAARDALTPADLSRFAAFARGAGDLPDALASTLEWAGYLFAGAVTADGHAALEAHAERLQARAERRPPKPTKKGSRGVRWRVTRPAGPSRERAIFATDRGSGVERLAGSVQREPRGWVAFLDGARLGPAHATASPAIRELKAAYLARAEASGDVAAGTAAERARRSLSLAARDNWRALGDQLGGYEVFDSFDPAGAPQHHGILRWKDAGLIRWDLDAQRWRVTPLGRAVYALEHDDPAPF